MKKRYLTILIVLLVVGFATVTANLILNGYVSILADQEAFAKDVIFTKAKIKGGSAVIENEGKSITFVSPTIRSLNEETILNFTITNYNRQYDAEATIKCDFVKDDTLLGEEDFSEYIDVKTDETKYFIPASGNTPGQVISTLKKSYTGEQGKEIKIECELIVEAKSKDYLEDELARPNPDNTIKNVPNNYTGEFWAYKTEITNIVFENELNPHTGDNVEKYNISESGTGTVIAYYDKDAKTVYIQGDGKIFANLDSSNLFKDFTNLQTIDGLEFLDTSYVTNMSYMFNNCNSLTNLNGIGTLDTSSVTTMYYMFSSSRSLTSLEGIEEWDTSSVTDMSYAFYDCSSLENVGDLSSWDTSKVTNMSNLFSGCSKLERIEGINNWNTSSVTLTASMFYGCSKLTTLDLNNWNTSSVKSMVSMFQNCSKLTSLDISNWNTSSVNTMSGMFWGCSALTNLDIGSWNTSSVTGMSSMFYGCSKLTTLDLNNWNTSSVKNMVSTFQNCSKLTNLDISNWNTSSVTTMANMFWGCSALTNLDVASWNTSSVTNMSGMFVDCSKLERIEGINNWNTSSVTSMSSIFYGCSKLTTLDLNNWNTSSVTNMSGMFYNCIALKSIEGISNWDTSSVTTMANMFQGCNILNSLDLNSWDTSSVTAIQNLFLYCYKLTATINILSTNITNYSSMFSDASTMANTQITVNYISENSALVEDMLTTATSSNVKKGDEITSNTVTITQNGSDIKANTTASNYYPNVRVTLTSETGKKIVSFKVNGELKKGNTFKMPATDVEITEVITE